MCGPTCTTLQIIHTLAQAFGWAGFGLNIAAMTGRQWVDTAEGPEGLYSRCNNTGGTNMCTGIPVGESSWLDATRAFLIISLIINSSGNFSYGPGFRGRNKALATGGYGFLYLSALFMTIGMAIYTGFKSQVADAWGYAFALGWVAVGMLNLAGGFAHVSVSMQEQEGSCYEEKTGINMDS